MYFVVTFVASNTTKNRAYYVLTDQSNFIQLNFKLIKLLVSMKLLESTVILNPASCCPQII